MRFLHHRYHFCSVMQFTRWPFGGVTAWVESCSVEQCICTVQLQVWRKMPQKISETLPTKVHTSWLISWQQQHHWLTNCADSQEIGWYRCIKKISWVTSSGNKCFKTCSKRATKLLQLWWPCKALSVHTFEKSSYDCQNTFLWLVSSVSTQWGSLSTASVFPDHAIFLTWKGKFPAPTVLSAENTQLIHEIPLWSVAPTFPLPNTTFSIHPHTLEQLITSTVIFQ